MQNSPNEKLKEVMELIGTIQKSHADLVEINPAQLDVWSVRLAGFLIFLGQDFVHQKREYNKRLNAFRRTTKSKADAEIAANDSEEWQRAKELEFLHDDCREMLMVVKKFIDRGNEERKGLTPF